MRKDLCNARAKHDPNVQHVYYSTLASQCSLFQFISGAYAIYLTIPSPPILTSQATHHINLWNRNKDILKVWMKDGHRSRKWRIFQNLIEYFVKCTYICLCVESVLVKLWSMGGCSWGRNARVHTQWGGASRSKDSSEEGKKLWQQRRVHVTLFASLFSQLSHEPIHFLLKRFDTTESFNT